MRQTGILTAFLVVFACFGQTVPPGGLKRLGYSVQVGAFGKVENAAGLEKKLQALGLDAFHFRHEDGLYKVRFGDYRSYREARAAGTRYKSGGLIGFFFIISPATYRISGKQPAGTTAAAAGEAVRKDLLATAARFLGIPYRWGGTTAANGFDCSGLTLTVYRLNGLKLPRSASAQMQAGKPVAKTALKAGDLVFFDTMGRGTISHVGMYTGAGQFIHAPRRGKAVEYASLGNSYFRRTWRGARSYF